MLKKGLLFAYDVLLGFSTITGICIMLSFYPSFNDYMFPFGLLLTATGLSAIVYLIMTITNPKSEKLVQKESSVKKALKLGWENALFACYQCSNESSLNDKQFDHLISGLQIAKRFKMIADKYPGDAVLFIESKIKMRKDNSSYQPNLSDYQ